MKRDHTARRGRPFAASVSAPSCSVLLRPAPQHAKQPVTDRSLRSPHHRAADGLVAAPVRIHTHRSTIPRREYYDHSKRPELPAQDHGYRDAVPLPNKRRSTS